ncbi:hypothetical protein QYM36_018184 [Artemia franciscana]|uniref:SUN domain-containing protein n=1 Tax=Artemia franciscana TaxID=6661 RepID=A0AA88KUV8_ARTSF|nr:hypothetical protein QYM36_018184 [Artemia franciscana]
MTKSPVFICPSNINSLRKEFVNISIDPIQSDILHLIDIPDTKPFKSHEEIFEQGSEKNPKTFEKLLSEINDVTIDAVNSSEKPPSEFQSMSQPKVNAESNITGGIGSQQKETVFVRLSNKLRTLEKNMTLSVEYLEKLSKVYKRKVEDLQKALNQTTGLVTVMGEQLNLLEEKYKRDFVVVKKNQEMLQKSLNTLCELSEKMLQAEKAKNGTAKAQRNGIKMRLSNYASLSCGPKTSAANPEAENLKAILDSSYDDYMLSPCSSKSCDRYPAKEWVVLGSFSALDERQEQSFDLDSEHFGKFLKVEVLSHFRNEHYSPITFFRVFGTSEFEVLEKDHNEDEDFSTAEEMLEDLSDNRTPSISVKDAVINFVKIAVEKVAGTKAANESTAEAPLSGETVNLGIELATPSYNCDLQSDFFEFYLKLFKNTQICKSYGFDSSGGVCCESKSVTYTLYIATMLGPKTMKCFCDYYLQRMTESPVFTCPSNISSPRKEFINISVDPIQSDMLHLIDIPDTKPFKIYEEIFEQGSEKNPKTIEQLFSEINDVTMDIVNSSEKPPSEFQSMSPPKVAESNVTVGIGSQQKETVFVRLSNKLRTLEKNMTLSVEYLEKLSKDYKRKVEDLQKALNQTTGLVTVMGEQLNLLEEKYKGDFGIVKKNQEMLQKVLMGLGLKLETEEEQQSLISSSRQSEAAIGHQKYSSLANSPSNGRRVFYVPLFESSVEKTAESKTICIDDLGSCEKSLSGRVSSRSSQKKRRNSKS